jgi:PKD repeat protein
MLVMIAALVGWAGDASAFESYHDPNQNDTGYCSDCHPGFAGGRSDVTHALHTGGSDPVTTNCDLCHTGSGRDNPLTMWSTGDADDGQGCAGCHGRDYGETVGADYRGFPITGLPKSSGYGLRRHHANNGITQCESCHGVVAIEPENVSPAYYARADVSLGGSPMNPCTNEDTANDADALGLDNDGDLLYDADDADCLEPQPPVADANGPYAASINVSPVVQFDGSGSSDPDGTIVAFDWDFGDGNTGTGVSPTHTYTATGVFTVTLTVTDDDGLTDSAATTATITFGVLPPTADPNGPYTGIVGTPVLFDGSASSDDSMIVSYDWEFGDGNTGTGVSPTHSYATDGLFNVTLTVTDDDGLTDSAATTATIDPVLEPPVADPNGPYTGTVGSPVTFDGSGSSDPDGTIVSYDWDFGDGSTGTGVSPTHTYGAPGTFTVTLTVTDDDGLTDTASTTATIGDVLPEPPVADPNGPYTGTVGIAVTFDGSGSSDPDGTIVAYDWDFGDGSVGTGVSPTHTYGTDGVFTVTLTVTDDDGLTDSAATTATIGIGPLPPVADPNGPYSGAVGVPVLFDGTGSTDPNGNETIVAYDWDFGDGNIGTGPTPSHTYAAAGLYGVTLTVTDDGVPPLTDSASTTADISEAPVLDLDIAQFQVTKRVRLANVKPVKIKLVVRNGGTINSQTKPATVTGVQNGDQVYNEMLPVSDPVGDGRTRFDFPPYTPTAAGDILWTVTIDDDDADDDTAMATTLVQ